MFASELLEAALKAIEDRASQRDMPNGERSMTKAIATFNSLTGHVLTEREGWVFMVLLKLARAQAGEYQQDDYVDGAAYVALAGECEGNSPHVAIQV